MEVSSDGPWEEGSNGNHRAAGQRGFPETRHHHPVSLRKLFPEPCAPREWLPPECPQLPVLCPLQAPLPASRPWHLEAALPAVSLSFCFSHQLCLCVSVMCGAAEPRGPHHANPTSAIACGLVLVKRLRNFPGLSYVCVCEGG